MGSDPAIEVSSSDAYAQPLLGQNVIEGKTRRAGASPIFPGPISGQLAETLSFAANQADRLALGSDQRILVVDDDPQVADSHMLLLHKLGFKSFAETNPRSVEALIDLNPDIGLILLDIRMPGINGLDLLRQIKLRKPQVGVIMATVINDIEEAVRATRLGAYNYLLKPLQSDRLQRIVLSYFSNQPKRLVKDPRFSVFVTQSPRCEEVFRRISAFSQVDTPVLIQGETGTGKEVVARLLHALSPRCGKNFVAVNVAALPTHLFESELFGHRRGSFTGALRDQKGYFAQAGDGTLFLDEIGELSPELQKKLLRALETKRFAPVGQSSEIPLEARVVLATNRDLLTEVRNDSFRKDLYYRFSSHNINIPPLRERPEDIEILARYFLERYCAQYGRSLSGFASGTLEALKSHPFPGNVRELDGLISAAVLLEQATELRLESLPEHVRQPVPDEPNDLSGMRMQVIYRTLTECNGNQTRAAEKLGIARGTLNRLLREKRNKNGLT